MDFSEKVGSASIHSINLQFLATEISKATKGMSSPIIAELFQQINENHYNLRHNSQVTIPAANSVYHATENISFLGPKI